MNNTNNYTAELAFTKARAILKAAMWDEFVKKYGANANEKADEWVNSRKGSQSELRLECEFSTTTTVFKFGVLPQDANTTGVVFNTEIRLDPQDTLVANEYAVLVGQPASRTDTAWELRTYGNEIDFGAAFANQLNQTFYSHGKFSMMCNKDTIISNRMLWNHLYRGQTQQTAALGVASPNDQVRGAEDGSITDSPNIWLIGQKGYIPQITLVNALTAATAFSRMILVFRGVQFQNSTVIS